MRLCNDVLEFGRRFVKLEVTLSCKFNINMVVWCLIIVLEFYGHVWFLKVEFHLCGLYGLNWKLRNVCVGVMKMLKE